MKKSEIEKLLDKKYSVKQAIAYFLIGFSDSENKLEMKDILSSIVDKFVKIDNTKVLEMINKEFIVSIDYGWTLNIEQALCYCYLIFEALTKSKQTIKSEDIVNEFLVMAKLYSPDNTIECVNNKFEDNC